MSTISTEQAKDLRNAFECWQQDYDPVEDKEQYEMFGLGVVAMDELLALRKEREKAEPVAYMIGGHYLMHANDPKVDNYSSAVPLYTAPPAPSTDDDSLPYDPQIAEYEQMMEAEQAQADTTSQQFESLAGNAVVPISYLQGHKDGLEWAARLAEANHPQTSDWLYDDPLELAKAIRKGPDMPVSTVDGWIPCSERMPPENTGVLVATEFDGPGDWRMKWGTRVPGYPDAKNGWLIPGASWTPSHWQPLPEPPCK
ncbi:DUF551 domain-containing protein [Cronobacter sakazakii]|uniref:DUF551 domain-containing protein n=1 Tax=Cronobacter sakazakii TaxID=28141 RepID=UPI001FD84A6D|nr:DUF551 domain-containing protein [Cronobacter sakazakii]